MTFQREILINKIMSDDNNVSVWVYQWQQINHSGG